MNCSNASPSATSTSEDYPAAQDQPVDIEVSGGLPEILRPLNRTYFLYLKMNLERYVVDGGRKDPCAPLNDL